MKRLLIFGLILSFFLCHATSKSDFKTPNSSLLIPTVVVTTNGTAIVYRPGSNFVNWEIDFNGVLYNNIIASSQTFTINPFAVYNIRVRVYNGTWSEVATINSCTLDPARTVGYNFDFETSMIEACWRGYISNSNAEVYVRTSEIGHNGTPSTVIQMSSEALSSATAYLVPPKLDLSTDKKITFWLKGFRGDYLLVGSMTDPYDQSTFHLLQNVTSQWPLQNQWKKITIYLNNLHAGDQYIMIKFKETYLQSTTIYIDDFTYEQSIDCFPISNLSTSNLNDLTGTAQLNFDAQNQNAWEVNIKNLLTSEMQTQFVNSTSPTINNLIGNTTYEIKVRAVCGVEFNSTWSDLLTFTMPCSPISADYTTTFTESPILDPCWNTIVTGTSSVTVVNSILNGATVILAPKTGTKMVAIATNPEVTASHKAYLISPYISDLDNNKRIRFNLVSRCPGSTNRSSLIIGSMSDPNNYNTFIPLRTITPAEINDFYLNNTRGWKEHTIYLNNYNNSNGHHYLAFKHSNTFDANSSDNATTFYVDDLSYENIPACTEPLYPVVLQTGYNFAKLNWQSYQNATATAWQIEYGISGHLVGTGTLIDAASSTFTIENLPFDDTDYDFYVRSKCGNIYSDWSVKVTFKTRCLGITVGSTQVFESFTIGAVASCWTGLSPREFYISESIVTNTYPNLSHSGTKSVRLSQSTSQASVYPDYYNKLILVTPRLINFDNTKSVSFWIYGQSPKQFIVGTLSDAGNYATFSSYTTITTTNSIQGAWAKYTVNFSTYTGTDQYVGIKQSATNGNNIAYIDDFEYIGVPCTTPSSLQALQLSETSVSLQWNSNNLVNQPLQWQIEYGPIGFTTGTIITVNSNPFVVDGLSNPMNYEFRVKNHCSGGVSGDWSSRYSFRLACSFSAPFVENFEEYTSLEFGNPVNFCWTSDPNYTKLTNTCIEGLNSCGNSIRMNNVDSTNTPASGILISPYFSDLDYNKSIKFWIANNFLGSSSSSTQSSIKIGTVSNPLDFSTFVPYQTIDVSSLPLTGKEFIVDFSNYTGSSKYIVFVSEGEFISNEYHHRLTLIDDIKYMNTNHNCPEPLNIITQNINENSALVKWDQLSTAASYQIEYGLQGFTPGTGIIINTSNSETLISGLDTQTNYEYYIKSDCAGNISSDSIGPKKFKTTCGVQNIPWVENFDTMSQYGLNQLPACFRMYRGDTYASNVNGTIYNVYGDNPIFGYSDQYCLVVGPTNGLGNNFSSQFFTPTFSLLAGTTYTFSMMANKGYEFTNPNLRLLVGKGNTMGAMNVMLDGFGDLHQDQYNPYQFYYTPIVSGDYGFLLSLEYSGGIRMLVDQFKLAEGYTNLISQNNEFFYFESPSDKIILEGTTDSKIAIETDPSTSTNHNVFMRGNQNNAVWVNDSDAWIANESSITKINMKVNAVGMTQLFLKFKMRQTFTQSNQESMFRVVINGNVVGNVLRPTTQSQDAFIDYVYDLNAYLGGEIRISLQHIGKSDTVNSGDNAYLDNLRFSDTSLSQEEFSASSIKVYPNPFNNNITIKNNSPISKINLYDVRGQQLLNLDCNSSEINMDTSKFQAGIYFIKVNTDGKSETFKVIRY